MNEAEQMKTIHKISTEEALDMKDKAMVDTAAIEDDEEEEENSSIIFSPLGKADVIAFQQVRSRPCVFSTLIVLLGAVASAIILGFGIPAAKKDQRRQFERLADDLLNKFEKALEDYEVAGLWLHQACSSGLMNHDEFKRLYEYLLSTGLEFQAVSFGEIVTSEDRNHFENITQMFLQNNHPNVTYRGFIGFELDNSTGEVGVRPRSEMPFYFPIHYLEPLTDPKNQAALDFDISSEPVRWTAAQKAIQSWKPSVTERLKLIKERVVGTEAYAYSVILMHPGTPTSSDEIEQPTGLALLAIRFPEILARAHDNLIMDENAFLYIFDSTSSIESPPFLGGVELIADEDIDEVGPIRFLSEVELSSVKDSTDPDFLVELRLPIAGRMWTFVATAGDDSFEPDLFFIILAATMIFVSCICLALWVCTNYRRVAKINELQAHAEAEKAALTVENARKATLKERELNEFIAHEVRNPLSAAIAACSFVSSSVNEVEPLIDNDSRESVREDVIVIDNSLQFINDLLRNMLDVHRASSKQLNIETTHIDVKGDIFEPVASMLYRRGDDFDVVIDCPDNLMIMADKLRLKQTVMNLGRNSVKFVSKGFVRLRASIIDNNVHIFIEDSGPGIPIEKRKSLFRKFQESLDSLNQGTGIGLCLCKNLIELMGGELWLDETYDSGVPGCPGARFSIRLNKPPLCLDTFDKEIAESHSKEDSTKSSTEVTTNTLPETLSVLFVDDDVVLRKLFLRSIVKVAPGWKLADASNGETALRMVDSQSFDVIFVDQYMASVDRQLLGTETIRAMRAKGVKSIICGLSANDLVQAFQNAGADAFMIKPFPCGKVELEKELIRILNSQRSIQRLTSITETTTKFEIDSDQNSVESV